MSFGTILWSSVGSAFLLVLAALFCKEFIKVGINKTIGHLYDVKLESHKAQLTKEVDLTKNVLAKDLESYKINLDLINKQEIESLKSRLQFETNIAKIFLNRYSDKQFELYNELWGSLCELKFSVDKLWTMLSVDDLEKLATQLKATKHKVDKMALLIEPQHYDEMRLILDEFANFQFGKEMLNKLGKGRAKNKGITQQEITYAIDNNRQIKERLDTYLHNYMHCLRNQLTGGYELP